MTIRAAEMGMTHLNHQTGGLKTVWWMERSQIIVDFQAQIDPIHTATRQTAITIIKEEICMYFCHRMGRRRGRVSTAMWPLEHHRIAPAQKTMDTVNKYRDFKPPVDGNVKEIS